MAQREAYVTFIETVIRYLSGDEAFRSHGVCQAVRRAVEYPYLPSTNPRPPVMGARVRQAAQAIAREYGGDFSQRYWWPLTQRGHARRRRVLRALIADVKRGQLRLR